MPPPLLTLQDVHLTFGGTPLLEGSNRPYSMFKDYWKYDWVLPVCRYEGLIPSP